MNTFNRFPMAVVLAILATTTFTSRKEGRAGPAERAGKVVDKVIERAKDALGQN